MHFGKTPGLFTFCEKVYRQPLLIFTKPLYNRRAMGVFVREAAPKKEKEAVYERESFEICLADPAVCSGDFHSGRLCRPSEQPAEGEVASSSSRLVYAAARITAVLEDNCGSGLR